MSGDVSDKKRLVSVNQANIGNNHIYLGAHGDFFPQEAYGGSNKSKGLGRLLTVRAEGVPNPIKTDLAPRSGKGFIFRKRSWLGSFFKKHQIKDGDVVAIERIGPFEYRLYPFKSRGRFAAGRLAAPGRGRVRPLPPQRPNTIGSIHAKSHVTSFLVLHAP